MRVSRIKGVESEIALALRNSFADDDGKIAFIWLLRNGRYFDKLETEEDRIRYNFIMELLEAMGVYHLPHETEIAEGLLKTALVDD